MREEGDELIRALVGEFRARKRLHLITLAAAALVFVTALVLWQRGLAHAPRVLELRVDAAGSRGLELRHDAKGERAVRFDFAYPELAIDWDISIEATGQAAPASWDAQAWIQALRVSGQVIPWSQVEMDPGWQLVDSPQGAEGKAAVSLDRTARSLRTHARGGKLEIVYSRNAWNGLLRVVANGETHEIDAFKPSFEVATLTIQPPPGPSDRLDNELIALRSSAAELGSGTLTLAPDGGKVTLLEATLDGRPLHLRSSRDGVQAVDMPSTLGLTTLPALGMALAAALGTLVMLPLLLRVVMWRPFWSAVLALVLFKLWLISGDEMRAGLYDSRGYMLRALNGIWGEAFSMGAYERQPAYSIFIALNRLTGIPLRISLELVYLGSCLVPALALRRYGASRWVTFIAFALMSLHPLVLPVFANGYSDILYVPAFLLALGAMMHALPTRGTARLAAMAVSGFGLAAAWNTRPEHILLIALLAAFAGLVAVMEWLRMPPGPFVQPCTPRWRRWLALMQPRRGRRAALAGLLTLAPAGAVILCVTVFFAGMGRLHMGAYAVSNIRMPGFTALYNELLAIEPENDRPYWPIPRDVREKAYEASPTFRQLKPHLEGRALQVYSALAEASTPVKGDFGVFTFWALRMAPQDLRHWESADHIDRFYAQAAAELQTAREAGRYPSRRVWAAYVDPNPMVWLPNLRGGLELYWMFLTQPEPEQLPPEDPGVEPAIFDAAALRRQTLTLDNRALWTAKSRPELLEGKRAVARLLSVASIAGVVLTPPLLVLLSWRFIRRRDTVTFLPLALVLLLAFAFATRFIVMVLLHAVAFGAEGRYILPVAPLLPLLAVTSLLFAARALPRRTRPTPPPQNPE